MDIEVASEGGSLIQYKRCHYKKRRHRDTQRRSRVTTEQRRAPRMLVSWSSRCRRCSGGLLAAGLRSKCSGKGPPCSVEWGQQEGILCALWNLTCCVSRVHLPGGVGRSFSLLQHTWEEAKARKNLGWEVNRGRRCKWGPGDLRHQGSSSALVLAESSFALLVRVGWKFPEHLNQCHLCICHLESQGDGGHHARSFREKLRDSPYDFISSLIKSHLPGRTQVYMRKHVKLSAPSWSQVSDGCGDFLSLLLGWPDLPP